MSAGQAEVAVVLREVFCLHRSPDGEAAALQGLSLELRRAERVCVIGPSGAGKTTLLRVVAGLERPSTGAVSVFGADSGRLPARRQARLRHRWIGFLDQHAERSLFPDLTIAQSVALPLALRGVAHAQSRRRVSELLAAAGLADRARAFPDELSGGERQRAAVCAALVHRPPLLLADEPTAELDESSAAAVTALIAALAAAEGTTVLAVSHDPGLADAAQRTIQLREGRIVEQGAEGGSQLVIGRGGWLRLPDPLRARAGIDGAATATASRGEIVLRPVDGRPAGSLQTPVRPAVSTAEPALVVLEEVTRRRGHHAAGRLVLDGLCARFAPGKITAVTGRSGSGKTTLLELIAGLEHCDGGAVRVDGTPLEELGEAQRAAFRRRRVGLLSQEPVPVGFLSAAESVALALRIRGHSRAWAAARAAAALARLELSERAAHRVDRLSAGEVQRVALATALVSADGLLLADEPTSRLDRRSAGLVAAVLAEASQAGHTVICATHDPELIAIADQVLALDS